MIFFFQPTYSSYIKLTVDFVILTHSQTLDVYDGTSDFLRRLEMDDESVIRAIIGTIGDVDSYQLLDAKGYDSLLRHLLGVTEEERQRRREEILCTRPSDFKEFADVI